MNELAIALVTTGIFLLGAVAMFVWPRGKSAPTPKNVATIAPTSAPVAATSNVIDLDAIDRAARERAVAAVSERVIEAHAVGHVKTLVDAIADKPKAAS